MTEPDIAVVVLSYRNDATVLAAVDSLLEQDEPLEIVVSHSGDGRAPELLAGHAPSVRVVASEQRRLPGAARNAGIAATRAPFVAFLAADCIALPGWAGGRLRRHRAGADAVASALAPIDASPASLAAHLLRGSARMPHLNLPARYSGGVSYARSVFDRVGLFEDSLARGEDLRMNRRLLAAGIDIVWAPDVVTAHAYATTIREFLLDEFRRGRVRGSLSEDRRYRRRVMADPLVRAPKSIWRATRPGSPIPPSVVARAAPLVAAGALASSLGAASNVRGAAERPQRRGGESR